MFILDDPLWITRYTCPRHSHIDDQLNMKKMDTNLTAYQNIIKGMNPDKARLTISKLESKVGRIMAKAQRAARKYEDCGPIDQVHEQVSGLQTIIDGLKWYLEAGTTEPAGALQTSLISFMADHNTRAHRLENPSVVRSTAIENIVGKTIHFRNKQRQEISGIVISQKIHRRSGEIVYRTQNGWRIPHRLLLRPAEETPSQKVETLNNREMMVHNSLGKTVEWNSRKLAGLPRGKVIKVGKTRLTVEIEGNRLNPWKVPFSMITKVDGLTVPAL